VASRAKSQGVLDAVPGARATLRWYGWLAIGLLVVPAAALAIFATKEDAVWVASWIAIALLLVGLVALAATGLVLFVALSRMRRVGELAQLLCEQGPDPIFVKDVSYQYRYVNEAAAALIGRSTAGVLGRPDSQLRPGNESLAFEENDRVCLERDLPTLFRETQTVAGGRTRSFLVSKRPLHDARGRITGLIGSARDITDELELQKLNRRRGDETRAWFDLNPLPVVIFASADLRILKVNMAAERCYGYSQSQMLRMRLPELFAREEVDRVRKYLGEGGQAVAPGSVAWRHQKADGESFAALTDIANLAHEDVPSRGMMVRDVSELNTARAALESIKSRYEDLVESGLTMVWVHDLDGRLLRVNDALADALGYERENMLGRGLADFVPDDSRETWTGYMERVRSLRRDAGVLHVASRNGERRVWQYQFVCYPDAEPTPYVLGTAQDVTLRHRYELRMRDQNKRDSLTGCRTRRYLDAFAWQAEPDQTWGCIVTDIDYFRQVNASEGRERGDELLKEMASMLTLSAGSGDAVVRLGGDEFAIIVANASADGVQELGERLAAAARDGMPVAFSLGWAVREAGEPLESTLRRADKMLLLSRTHERT